LFRWALRLDAAHVTVFTLRALTSRAQAGPRARAARAARADAIVAAAGLALAVAAWRRDARAPVAAGLVLNTTGCLLTLVLHARAQPPSRPTSLWWTTYLLIGGDAVSLAYLAAGRGPDAR
jgi:hypothetical protein